MPKPPLPPFTKQFLSLNANPAFHLGIALISGVLMALATAPVNAWGLAWIAMVPLWMEVWGAGVGDGGSGIRDQKLGIRDWGLRIRRQELGIRGWGLGIRERQSKIQNPKSKIQNSSFPHSSTPPPSPSPPPIHPSTVRLTLTEAHPPIHSPLLFAFFWGIGYHGTALSWITGLHPLMWLGVPWLGSIAIALFCWAFITLWGTALVVIWAWLMQQFIQFKIQNSLRFELSASAQPNRQPSGSRTKFKIILVGTALWGVVEWLCSLTPLYWTSLSLTQSPGNLFILHLGQLSGPAVVTAAIVAVNGLLAATLLQLIQNPSPSYSRSPTPDPRPPLLTAIALFLSLHLLGFALYSQPLTPTPETALKVGIVQGNVPTRIKLTPEGIRQAFDGYIDGYEALADQGVQAVLTPEGALPIYWDAERNPFRQAVLQKGVAAWLGIFVRQDRQITQSLLSIAGNGDVVGRYNKIKLVPLGEYIPFREVLGGLISRLSPIEASMVPGTSTQRFETPFGRAIAGICYESPFPELFRVQAAAGGKFILTASNLDPYSQVLMAQHQAQDLMRAIETDRWAVRATNTGYSSMIDPHGQILWRSQPHTYEIHAETIYRRQTQTLYVRWGDWLTPLLIGVAAIVLVWPQSRDRPIS